MRRRERVFGNGFFDFCGLFDIRTTFCFTECVAAEVRLPSWSRTRETQNPQQIWGRGERSQATDFKATFKAKPDS